MKAKSIDVSFELLETWLQGCGKTDTYVSNLPEDAKIIRIEPHWYNNPSTNKIKIILVSEKWKDLQEGDLIPKFSIVMTETYDQFEEWNADDI